MSGSIHTLTLVTALGCGLVAGVFFAFSSFVMPALDRLPDGRAVEAMQSINKLAVTPVFMTAVFGTALACAVLGVWGVLSWERPAARWVVAGAALYLLGAVLVTGAGNVPLNDALARADQWPGYVRDWTLLNHVRTVTSLAAAALLTVALTAD
jgi:uncharacterized membrane protein